MTVFRDPAPRFTLDYVQANVVSPAPAWNGTAGSGFGTVPTDPARATAKPALRLLTPPREVFADTLVVGVAAFALDGGSLAETGGLQEVVCHFEGGSVSIARPSVQEIVDANGNRVRYLGWWAVLKRPEGDSGNFREGQVYFEAVPRDATMQRRVIGPFAYLMSDTLHDIDITVAPSQSELTDKRYQTRDAALARVKQLSPKNPRVTIAEPGKYTMGDNGVSSWDINGWCSIRASVPGVSIGKLAYTTDAAGVQIVQRLPLRLQGENLSMDFRHVTEMQGGARIWFDGCSIIASGDGTENLRRGVPPTLGVWLVRGTSFGSNAWYTECHATGVHHCYTMATLARGCTADDVAGDVFTDAVCAIGCSILNYDNRFWYSDRPMMEVAYNGAGAATLARSGSVGGGGAGGGLFTATFDGNQSTFQTGNQEAHYTGALGDGYWPQDLADWLNSLPGWNANVLDNRFAAAYACLANGKGQGFAATAIGAAPLTIYACYDGHGDFWQQNNAAVDENVIIADNIATNLQAQGFFVSPTLGTDVFSRDMIFVNNGLHFDPVVFGYWNYAVGTSQLGRQNNKQSHVVLAHNSLAGQNLYIRTDNAGMDFGDYCAVIGNVVRAITWGGAADADLALVGNHLYGGVSAPELATGTTTGGDESTLFVDAAAGDFSPAGALLNAPLVRAARFDRTLAVRGEYTARGAIGSAAIAPPPVINLLDGTGAWTQQSGSGTMAGNDGIVTITDGGDGDRLQSNPAMAYDTAYRLTATVSGLSGTLRFYAGPDALPGDDIAANGAHLIPFSTGSGGARDKLRVVCVGATSANIDMILEAI
ncbi:MAG: hypothetical protein WBA68_03785 [Alteraurantiacibacter sp.]